LYLDAAPRAVFRAQQRDARTAHASSPRQHRRCSNVAPHCHWKWCHAANCWVFVSAAAAARNFDPPTHAMVSADLLDKCVTRAAVARPRKCETKLLPRTTPADTVACVGRSRWLTHQHTMANRIEHLMQQQRFAAGISNMGRGSVCFALVEYGTSREKCCRCPCQRMTNLNHNCNQQPTSHSTVERHRARRAPAHSPVVLGRAIKDSPVVRADPVLLRRGADRLEKARCRLEWPGPGLCRFGSIRCVSCVDPIQFSLPLAFQCVPHVSNFDPPTHAMTSADKDRGMI